jgi:hypothetical protein
VQARHYFCKRNCGHSHGIPGRLIHRNLRIENLVVATIFLPDKVPDLC